MKCDVLRGKPRGLPDVCSDVNKQDIVVNAIDE